MCEISWYAAEPSRRGLTLFEVFYWCRGQDDNIGDVLLRRRFLRELRALGRVHVLIGKASDGFVEAMGFERSDILYRSQRRWVMALYKEALVRGVVLAVNPGEVRVDAKSAIAYLSVIPAQMMSRVHRGKSLQTGVAIRGRHPVLSLPISFFGRNADIRTSREVTSEVSSTRVVPDWAFDELDHRVDGLRTPRTVCALTFRDDRPNLAPPVIEAIRKVCAERALNIVVFTQVRRDNDRSAELAKVLGAELLRWDPDVSHLAQERAVRELMARSEAVISDRIHALIMGTSEGATPVGLIPGPDNKVGPHFAAAEISGISADVSQLDADSVEAVLDEILHRRNEIDDQVAQARMQVAELGAAVRSLTSSTSVKVGE